MAPAARSKPLAIGDTVSVAVRQFGEAYARKVAGRSWASDRERCEGLLGDRDGEFCLVEFDDMPEPVRFKRTLLQFVARESAVAGSKDVPLAADSSEDDEQAEQPRRPRTTKASAARAAVTAHLDYVETALRDEKRALRNEAVAMQRYQHEQDR